LKRKASIRFAEQGWMWLYYAFFWTFGMVRIISQSVVRFSVLTVDLVCLVSIQPLDGFQRHLG
jgi:hypothetical protein